MEDMNTVYPEKHDNPLQAADLGIAAASCVPLPARLCLNVPGDIFVPISYANTLDLQNTS